MERPAGAFFPEKMTSLEILDMSFIIFDVFSQYLDMIGWFGLDYKPWKMLWSVPQGLFFPIKLRPWNFGTCLLSFLMFFVNIWS